MERITNDLATNEQHLAQILHWPKNLGITFRPLSLATTPAAGALLIWVDGLASADALSHLVLRPLADYRGALTQADLMRQMPIGHLGTVCETDRLIEAVLAGYGALLVDGWEQAFILDVAAPVQHHAGSLSRDPHDETHARSLRTNIALIRKRLRDPRLRALHVDLAQRRAGGVALLYLEGRASPVVVRAVRRWAHGCAGEEGASEGLMQRASVVLGLLPRFNAIRWVNQTAQLLDSGYVVLLIDGMHYAYTAPVTHASWVASPSDVGMVYPLKRWLARIRLGAALIVLLLPATVVALLNYHQEMVPVSFLLAVASARENAPFGIFLEVLGAELLVEAGREAGFRLPVAVTPGLVVIALLLILLITVQTGFIGPAPALATALGTLLSLSLPSYGGAYQIRVWRLYLLVGAAILGFFGIAAVLFVLLIYLHQARSWGVPFVGPAGWELAGPERKSSQRPRMRERRGGAHGTGLIR